MLLARKKKQKLFKISKPGLTSSTRIDEEPDVLLTVTVWASSAAATHHESNSFVKKGFIWSFILELILFFWPIKKRGLVVTSLAYFAT